MKNEKTNGLAYNFGRFIKGNLKLARIVSGIFLTFMVGVILYGKYQEKSILDEQKRKADIIKESEIKEAELNEKYTKQVIQSVAPFSRIFIEYNKKVKEVNKFDRFDVFKKFEDAICKLPSDFVGWPLIVAWTGVTDYGAHYAKIGFEDVIYKDIKIYFSMTGKGAASNDPLFETGYNDFSRGSYLYEKIKTLKAGDHVKVSGKLMSSLGCGIHTGIIDEYWLDHGAFYLNFYIKDIQISDK